MIDFSDYQVKELIYTSANSLVYRGWRKQDELPVILKVLKPDYPLSKEPCYS
jgi:serine/threonine protein kinase